MNSRNAHYFNQIDPKQAGPIWAPIHTVPRSGMTAGFARLDHAPRIVVAEDDEQLRALVVQILADDGFKVFEAAHAEEALKILCSNAKGVAALFTDIDMPGSMNGLELAARARQRWPWLRVIIGSGVRPASLPSGGSFPPQTVHGERPARTYAGVDRQNATIALAFL